MESSIPRGLCLKGRTNLLKLFRARRLSNLSNLLNLLNLTNLSKLSKLSKPLGWKELDNWNLMKTAEQSM